MAWQMPALPAAGQWTAAVGMPQDMNMGTYTPEQWAVLQQQNWHQWAQWQQQYSQWQAQYGDKFAQHLQAGQPVGGMPPLPVGTQAPAPAPPLPDQPPPPPPPHENNQPLFATNKNQAPSATTQRNAANFPNTNSTSGNNQWSYDSDKDTNEALSAVNSEALKKLAEEQKNFDLQFLKWEEEIDRWQKENVNHPDKKSYKEYEERFEVCRAQLVERRQQMILKRARLLNSTSQAANSASGNTPISAPPLPPNSPHNNNYNQTVHTQNYKNNTLQQDYTSQASHNLNNNKNIDPQDRYESYQDIESGNHPPKSQDSYPSAKSDPSTFLQTGSSSKGIPGLDLVPEPSHAHRHQDIVDITEESPEVHQPPDYSKISKGINNILGDAKIMNILSMVQEQVNTGQNLPHNEPYSANHQNYPPNQGYRNPNSFDQQYGNRPNIPFNSQGPNFPIQQNQDMNFQHSHQQNMYNQVKDMPQDQFMDRNSSYGAPNRGMSDMRQVAPGMRQGNFDMRQSDSMRQEGSDTRQGGPDMRYGGPDMRQGGPNMRQSGPDMRQGGPNMRQGGPDMRQGGPDIRQAVPDMRQAGPDLRQAGPDMRQAGPEIRQACPDMRQGGPDIRQAGQIMSQGGPDIRQAGPIMSQGGPGMRQGGPDIRQAGPDMRQGGPDMRQGGPNLRQGGPNMRQGGPNMRQGGPDMRQSGPNVRLGGPDMHQGVSNMQQGGLNMQQGGSNMQQGGSNMQQGGSNMQQSLLQDMRRPGQGNQPSFDNASIIPPLMSLNSRPLPPDIGAQPIANDYYGTERPMCENNSIMSQPPRPKWVEEPLFTPSLVVDYEHKPLRLKARDFIEPVHTFDYNHRSKDEDLNSKKKDFEKEVEELFTRNPRRHSEVDRYEKDLYHRDYERRVPREEGREMRDARDMRPVREDFWETREDFRDRMRDRPRDSSRDDFERPRADDRFDDRRREETRDFRRDDRRDERREDRRDDRDRPYRRDDFRERERERDSYRPASRDIRRDDNKIRSTSKELDIRKRGLSKDNETITAPKKAKAENKHTVMIDDLLEPPGRSMRPEKIVIILRGLPGSGKSYLAKLIRDREAEHGGTARIMSIDDYFMQEGETEEKDPQTGKIIKKPFLKYEYDEESEESYLTSLKRAFKRSLTDGYFSFLIYDAVNDQLKSYADVWNFARQSGFQVYVCTMEHDLQTCFKRNIHNRTLEDLEVIKARFFETPAHHIQLDATTLLQSASITEVQMEDVQDDVIMEDVQEVEVESVFTSKWEKKDDAAQLARLDGTSKPLRSSQLSMEDYLQLDEWKPNTAKPGKKTVRWADIEERREQEKIRAIGFVVGQTDWNRMTDPTMGSSALTQTKYIERVRRN